MKEEGKRGVGRVKKDEIVGGVQCTGSVACETGGKDVGIGKGQVDRGPHRACLVGGGGGVGVKIGSHGKVGNIL